MIIRTRNAISALPLLLCSSLNAQGPLVVGDRSEADAFRWKVYAGDMSAEEYRQAYRDNQDQVLDFVENYSESTLISLGIPRKGVHMMGAVVGAAIGQDATLYLNDSKSLAIDIKDPDGNDRAVYLGVKLDW